MQHYNAVENLYIHVFVAETTSFAHQVQVQHYLYEETWQFQVKI